MSRPTEIDQGEARKMVEELLDVDEGLTDWEIDFIESVFALPKGSTYTMKQLEKIDELWQRHCC